MVCTTVLITGLKNDTKRSMLFQIAVFWAEEGCKVLYFTKTKFDSVPPLHGPKMPSTEVLSKIKILYFSDSVELLRSIIDIVTFRDLTPRVILVEGLEEFFTSGDEHHRIAKICATLCHVTACCAAQCGLSCYLMVTMAMTLDRLPPATTNLFRCVWSADGNSLTRVLPVDSAKVTLTLGLREDDAVVLRTVEQLCSFRYEQDYVLLMDNGRKVAINVTLPWKYFPFCRISIIDMLAEELTIPTPWGHIAAKGWGASGLPQVLAVHGMSDNAASFDQLMPLVCGRMRVVCVDLPGLGLSSHLPPGLPLCLLHHVLALKLVVDHLGWTHFTLLAHSIGSHIAVYFASIFPDLVNRLFLIDAFFVNIIPEDFVLERTQVTFDKLAKLKTRQKLYDFEESLKKLSEDRQSNLSRESALALQKRAFRKTPGGYVYNNDLRLKMLTYPLISCSFHFGLIRGLDCQVLVISTSEFEQFLSLPVTERTTLELSGRLGPKIRVVRVQGSHDIHMDQPQTVADIMLQFLLQIESHL